MPAYIFCCLSFQAKLKQEQEEKEREILAEKQAALQRRKEEMKLAKQVLLRVRNIDCYCTVLLVRSLAQE